MKSSTVESMLGGKTECKTFYHCLSGRFVRQFLGDMFDNFSKSVPCEEQLLPSSFRGSWRSPATSHWAAMRTQMRFWYNLPHSANLTLTGLSFFIKIITFYRRHTVSKTTLEYSIQSVQVCCKVPFLFLAGTINNIKIFSIRNVLRINRSTDAMIINLWKVTILTYIRILM